ncbi:hypothetical protein TTRE_0000060701 [Trichuris trichiura]|uniref:Uncharacterized protein n=1 Tax=Trichuris trichiura TaxID=36087 RepID=A0A077YY17_TRITR|nr:hypothetical protein TTRE_0000060701 [Trichuris trichiura]
MWSGAVWCGAVWGGVERCGVERCGVVWSGAVWGGVEWRGVGWRGVGWRVARCGVARCGRGVVWRGVGRVGRCGVSIAWAAHLRTSTSGSFSIAIKPVNEFTNIADDAALLIKVNYPSRLIPSKCYYANLAEWCPENILRSGLCNHGRVGTKCLPMNKAALHRILAEVLLQ